MEPIHTSHARFKTFHFFHLKNPRMNPGPGPEQGHTKITRIEPKTSKFT